VADVDELKKIKNTRGTSWDMGATSATTKSTMGWGPKLPKNQNTTVCFVFKLVRGP